MNGEWWKWFCLWESREKFEYALWHLRMCRIIELQKIYILIRLFLWRFKISLRHEIIENIGGKFSTSFFYHRIFFVRVSSFSYIQLKRTRFLLTFIELVSIMVDHWWNKNKTEWSEWSIEWVNHKRHRMQIMLNDEKRCPRVSIEIDWLVGWHWVVFATICTNFSFD